VSDWQQDPIIGMPPAQDAKQAAHQWQQDPVVSYEDAEHQARQIEASMYNKAAEIMPVVQGDRQKTLDVLRSVPKYQRPALTRAAAELSRETAKGDDRDSPPGSAMA